MSQNSERQLLEEISFKLDQVIALMSIAGKEQTDQIRILRGFGFDWNQIGQLVGLKPDAARMRLKNHGKKPRKAGKEAHTGLN